MNGDERQLASEQGDEDAVVRYDVDDGESITHAVATAVGSASATNETELAPLYSALDPDALEDLFAPHSDGTPRDAEGHVTFSYGSHRVRVGSDGTVVVY